MSLLLSVRDEVLRNTHIQAGRRILGISWDEAWHLMDRSVQRGLRLKPKRIIAQLGVDEKQAGAGQDYVTIVCDLERAPWKMSRWKIVEGGTS